MGLSEITPSSPKIDRIVSRVSSFKASKYQLSSWGIPLSQKAITPKLTIRKEEHEISC